MQFGGIELSHHPERGTVTIEITESTVMVLYLSGCMFLIGGVALGCIIWQVRSCLPPRASAAESRSAGLTCCLAAIHLEGRAVPVRLVSVSLPAGPQACCRRFRRDVARDERCYKGCCRANAPTPHNYLAHHICFTSHTRLVASGGKTYVLKRIGCANVNAANQALLEAGCLQRLRHPNVVRFEDLFMHRHENGGCSVLIVMEYCAGGDLIDRLECRGGERALTELQVVRCETTAPQHAASSKQQAAPSTTHHAPRQQAPRQQAPTQQAPHRATSDRAPPHGTTTLAHPPRRTLPTLCTPHSASHPLRWWVTWRHYVRLCTMCTAAESCTET